MITRGTLLADAAKCVLVSYDLTMRSSLSVGMPIDLICYQRDSLEVRHRALLDSHRGYDPGALRMAKESSDALGAPLVGSTVSRLVIDLNRSIGHPRLFSETTRSVPATIREEIVERHYRPYRAQVEQCVAHRVSRRRRVIHISSHTFTPVLAGEAGQAGVGILYDPRRCGETALCARWKASLAAMAPGVRVRRNYPYAGNGDGLTSHLRRRFAPDAYVGIELEVNQSIVFARGRRWPALRKVLIESLRQACGA